MVRLHPAYLTRESPSSGRADAGAAPRRGDVARAQGRDRIYGERHLAAHPLHQENGATAIWGYSHREEKSAYIGDEDTIIAEMEVGSVLIFLGSTLHGQSPNTSDEVRRALIVGYSLSWLKQFENQFLCYPPEVARNFPPGLAELVGYGAIPFEPQQL
jgi:ectoine hydroxylase-related dioxygenase (phytanoyl-CoA dioxygenase family)